MPSVYPDLRLSGWFRVVRDTLKTARMTAILGGPNRVYVNTEAIPELPETQVWAQVVVVPIVAMNTRDIPDARRLVPFLVRVDVNNVRSQDYDPAITAEAAHEEIKSQLQFFVAPPAPHKYVQSGPIWRERPPPSSPIYDDSRGLWMASAEYRAYLAPNP